MIAIPTAAPAAPSKKTSSPFTFETLLTHATRLMGSKSYALDLGITEEALVQYADGAVFDEGECAFIESVIAKNEWSRRIVVSRVKGKRKKRVAA
jgi:hypothetical protein